MSKETSNLPKPRCPNCGSRDVKHKDEYMKQMNHSAGHHLPHQVGHALHGHSGGLLFLGGCWVAGKVMHSLTKSWTCNECDHRFY